MNVKAGVFPGGNRVNLFGAIDFNPGPFGGIVFDNLGDAMPLRVQGQTIIQGNRISNALQAGIVVVPQGGEVDELTGKVIIGDPGHTNSVANLPTINTSLLVPAAVIKDNLFYNAGQTAIVFSGSPQTDIPHAIPFGRIVNNTITKTPNGLQVVNNASPTVLNNI